MEQNRYNANGHQQGRSYQPPVVSGSEVRRVRTGVAMRQNMMQQRQESQPTPGCNCKVQCANPSTSRTIGPGKTKEGTGILPDCAPLANPYVPFQRENPPRYCSQRALSRGTLYPGLDLPLCGMINADKPETAKTRLMALEFAVVELALYLDMHPDDQEAIAVYCDYVARAKEAKAAYEKKHGPLTLASAGGNNCWDWICDPWPWDYCQEG